MVRSPNLLYVAKTIFYFYCIETYTSSLIEDALFTAYGDLLQRRICGKVLPH
jgi:hypothetical protein